MCVVTECVFHSSLRCCLFDVWCLFDIREYSCTSSGICSQLNCELSGWSPGYFLAEEVLLSGQLCPTLALNCLEDTGTDWRYSKLFGPQGFISLQGVHKIIGTKRWLDDLVQYARVFRSDWRGTETWVTARFSVNQIEKHIQITVFWFVHWDLGRRWKFLFESLVPWPTSYGYTKKLV